MSDVADRVRSLVADVLDVAEHKVTMETACGELSEWDSLAHLRLMTAFEEEFGIRPSMAQVNDTKTVADLVALAGGAT
jgi:acyl carrier protein